MRPLTLLFSASLLIGATALAAGCSSDDSTTKTPSGDYAPAGNGVPMGESEACKAITAAEDTRLSCGPKTRPPCPTYINKGNEPCSLYDQGTVQACVEWIGKISCADFKSKKCIVKVLPGTAPNGCAVLDAGDDSGQDAGEDAADAGEDAMVDAPDDTTADAPDDATDAASDSGDDGATEAGSDAAGD